jgi:hypothetical protein
MEWIWYSIANGFIALWEFVAASWFWVFAAAAMALVYWKDSADINEKIVDDERSVA